MGVGAAHDVAIRVAEVTPRHNIPPVARVVVAGSKVVSGEPVNEFAFVGKVDPSLRFPGVTNQSCFAVRFPPSDPYGFRRVADGDMPAENTFPLCLGEILKKAGCRRRALLRSGHPTDENKQGEANLKTLRNFKNHLTGAKLNSEI